jgi:hypothetical protein
LVSESQNLKNQRAAVQGARKEKENRLEAGC